MILKLVIQDKYLYYYDINSSYPFVMKTNLIPIKPKTK